MPEPSQFPLVTTSGQTGWVFRRSRFLDRNERNLVRLDDGREFEVPSEILEVRPDGSFVLDLADEPKASRDDPPADPEPRAEVHRAESDGTFELDQPLFAEEAGIERVAVNRIVDHMPETRQDGDVTVVPVVEEVLVVEKRLLLKEEVRITRRRNLVREPRRVIVDGSGAKMFDARGDEIRSRA